MARKKRSKAPRTASGQLSRSKSAKAIRHEEIERQSFEEGPQQTVLRARRRQAKGVRTIEADRRPVSKDEAKRLRLHDRGTILGQWLAEGKLTLEQVQAAGDYAMRYEAFRSLNGLPKPTAKIASYSDTHGGIARPERIRAAKAAKAAHMADQAKLRHCTAGTRDAMRKACIAETPAPFHLVLEGIKALMR